MKRIIASFALIVWLSTATQVFAERDLETGVFLSRDPAGFVDGPNLYGYVNQNPWTKFDPHGLNEVIISGGINANKDGWDVRGPSATGFELPAKVARAAGAPVAHDRNWSNFVDAARTEIQHRKQNLPGGEKIEWHVEVMSYAERARQDGKASDSYVKDIRKMASDESVDVRFFGTKEGLTNNLNTSIEGSARKNQEKISRLTYFGHGSPGELMLQYRNIAAKPGEAERFSSSDIPNLDKGAFVPGAPAISYGCNSAAPDATGVSFRDAWKKNFPSGGEFYGVNGRTSYVNPANVVPSSSEKAQWVPEKPSEKK